MYLKYWQRLLDYGSCRQASGDFTFRIILNNNNNNNNNNNSSSSSQLSKTRKVTGPQGVDSDAAAPGSKSVFGLV